MDAAHFCYPKSIRLLDKKAYSFVFQDARRLRANFITVLHRPTLLEHARLGIIVPKKQVKRAVQRNQIKRIVRESFRMHQKEIRAIDMVFLGYKGVELLSNAQLRAQVDKLWQRLGNSSPAS